MRVLLTALAVAVFAWFLYVPSLGNGFVWDDMILIGSPEMRSLNSNTVERLLTTNFWDAIQAGSGMYRPLTALSFYTDFQLYGLNAAGFHQTNIILHAAVSAMVFLVVVEAFSAPALALISALWFAAFPMHVESVAWVAGRTDVIATLFALIALWFYMRWRRKGGLVAPILALLSYALALLGKEVAIVLPGVIMVYELVPRPDDQHPRRGRSRWILLLAMCAMVAAYFGVRRHLFGVALGQFERATHGVVQAAALSFSVVAHYAYKLIYPFRLAPESDFAPPQHFFNPHTLVGVAVVALAVAAVIRWRHHGAFVFAMAVIACGLTPVLHIVPANQIMAERFLYFPSFGYSILVGLAAMHLGARRRALSLAVFGVLLSACCVRTVTGTMVWRDDLTLFKKTVALAGDNPRAHDNLGASLAARGQYEEALNEFRRATELNPDYAEAWNAMGRVEDMLGRHAEALKHCARGVELEPDNVFNLNSLGMMQVRAHQYPQAAQSFRRVLELRPHHDYARFNLGLALYQQRDFDGAIRELSAVVEKDPEFVNGWFFIADSEAWKGNQDAAGKAATKFLSLHTPDDAMAAQARRIVAGGH